MGTSWEHHGIFMGVRFCVTFHCILFFFWGGVPLYSFAFLRTSNWLSYYISGFSVTYFKLFPENGVQIIKENYEVSFATNSGIRMSVRVGRTPCSTLMCRPFLKI